MYNTMKDRLADALSLVDEQDKETVEDKQDQQVEDTNDQTLESTEDKVEDQASDTPAAEDKEETDTDPSVESTDATPDAEDTPANNADTSDAAAEDGVGADADNPAEEPVVEDSVEAEADKNAETPAEETVEDKVEDQVSDAEEGDEVANAISLLQAIDYMVEDDSEETPDVEGEEVMASIEIVAGALDNVNEQIAVLEDFISDGGITQQAYQGMAMSIARDCGTLGHVFQQASMESLNRVGGRLETNKDLTLELEKAKIAGVEKLEQLFDKLVDAALNYLKKNALRLERSQKKIKALEEMASKLEGTPGDAKVSASAILTIDNKPATVKDLQDTTALLKKFASGKEIRSALTGVADAYKDVDLSSESSAMASEKAIGDALNAVGTAVQTVLGVNKDTKDLSERSLPNANEYETIRASDAMLGGFKVVVALGGSKTDRVPSIMTLPLKEMPKSYEMDALDKSDIMSYTKAAYEMLDALLTISNDFSVRPAQEVKAGVNKLKAELAKTELPKGTVDALTVRVKQMRAVAKLVREPSMSLVSRLTGVGIEAYNVALKSAKKFK